MSYKADLTCPFFPFFLRNSFEDLSVISAPFSPKANHKHNTNVILSQKEHLILFSVCDLPFYLANRNIRLFLRYVSAALISVSLSLGNEISQVEGLEGLHQLRELVLDRNRIKTLSENSFIGQNSLLELRLAENRIRELNHLDPLTELRKLFLGMNKLQVSYKRNRNFLACWILFTFRFSSNLHFQIANYVFLP